MYIWIKPSDTAVLRDHMDGYRIIDGPKEVKRDATWIRRLRDGDAVLCEDPSKVKAKAEPRASHKPEKKGNS